MTLGELAYLLDLDPKWVQNAAAAVGRPLPYTLLTAQRLAVSRSLVEATGMPMPRAYTLATDILKRHDGSRRPVRILDDGGNVTLTVEAYRILSAVNAGLSRLRTMYQPGQRGRPASLRTDPIRAAREYGLDLSLLAANLRRTPAERLRQLDAMLDFQRRVRRGPRRRRRG